MPLPSRKLASFPNSRIKPRPATREATTDQFTIPSMVPTLILSFNENRTYFNLRNLAVSAQNLRYGFTPLGDEGNPPVNLATDGFTLEAGDLVADEPSPQEIWVYNESLAPLIINVEEGQG